VRSVRLDPELEALVQRAAQCRGETVSEFLRLAAQARAEATLSERPSALFADVAGSVHGGGGRARRSGPSFTDALAADRSDR